MAAGAGRGLGDDPALTTWGPLLSQVSAPRRPLSFLYHFPVVGEGPTSPSPCVGTPKLRRDQGWGLGQVECVPRLGVWGGMPRIPTPPSLGMGVRRLVLAKLSPESELRCPPGAASPATSR